MEQKTDSLSSDQLDEISRKYGEKIEVISLIGKGGQKLVFHIKTPSRNDIVLKTIFVTPDSLERIRREIRAVSIIDHPNVPKIVMTNTDTNIQPNTVIWIIEDRIN